MSLNIELIVERRQRGQCQSRERWVAYFGYGVREAVWWGSVHAWLSLTAGTYHSGRTVGTHFSKNSQVSPVCKDSILQYAWTDMFSH